MNLFTFDDINLRTFPDGGEPWFAAPDIARLLGYGSTAAMTRHVHPEDRSSRELPDGPVTVISEYGIYAAVLKSPSDDASEVERWLIETVLPVLRGEIDPPQQLELVPEETAEDFEPVAELPEERTVSVGADLMPFTYEGAQFRMILVGEEPWFVAADACRMLDLRDTSSALKMVDDEDKMSLRRSDTPQFFGGIAPQVQFLTAVNESGLYALIFQSNKERAREVRHWVTSEVLPQIRKTGGYGQQVERLTPLEYARKLVDAEERVELEHARAIAAEAQIEADRPMVERAKNHASGTGMKTRQQFFREIKQWAHDEHGIEIKQADVMKFLSTEKLRIFARGNRSDSGQATAWAIEKGYAVNKEDTAENGRNFVTGKLTARGQEYAWDRIVRHIDANGTLELPPRIGIA